MLMPIDSEQSFRYNNKVPQAWLARSYPSQQSLASYVTDLAARLSLFTAWLEHGPPARFWLNGFFFTHAFLTAVKQNFARRQRLAIDIVDFHFEYLSEDMEDTYTKDGALVTGIFLEGARWNDVLSQLDESRPKVCSHPHQMMCCDLHDSQT